MLVLVVAVAMVVRDYRRSPLIKDTQLQLVKYDHILRMGTKMVQGMVREGR